MFARGLTGISGLLLSLSPASLALAQGAPPGSPAAPPPAWPAPPAEEPGPRFRWGISALGGPFFQDGNTGGIGGLDLRLGAQINRLLGVYAQPVVLVGGGASADIDGASVSALAMGGVGVLADFTFDDLFFVAVGPELLSGAAGQSSVEPTGTGARGEASAQTGSFFSVAARAGLAFGSMKLERRRAFVFGLELRTIFTQDPAFAPTLFVGYESF